MSDLRTELTAIYEQRGKLTGAEVVDAAKDMAHPLHDRFEWDDSIAGHKYRVQQAEQLIRSVKIEFTTPADVDPHYVRAFASTRRAGDPEAQGYRPTEEVVTDPLARKMLLRNMQRDINALQRRYGHLQEFAQMIAEEINPEAGKHGA